MVNYLSAWARLARGQRAVTSVEYAIIAGILVATILIGFDVLANDVSNRFSNIASGL